MAKYTVVNLYHEVLDAAGVRTVGPKEVLVDNVDRFEIDFQDRTLKFFKVPASSGEAQQIAAFRTWDYVVKS